MIYSKNYRGYALESRLHFRMHAAMLQLKAMMDPESAKASIKHFEDELLNSNHVDHLRAHEAVLDTDSVVLEETQM